MVRQSNRTPFNRDEWVSWRDQTNETEVEITEAAIHAGVAFGPIAEDRGKRIARDLRAYREYIGRLAFNKIADTNQSEFDWFGTADAP